MTLMIKTDRRVRVYISVQQCMLLVCIIEKKVICKMIVRHMTLASAQKDCVNNKKQNITVGRWCLEDT